MYFFSETHMLQCAGQSIPSEMDSEQPLLGYICPRETAVPRDFAPVSEASHSARL